MGKMIKMDLKESELVGDNAQQKNWRGILIALLVILIVMSLIAVAVILVTPKNDTKELGEVFSFEDMFNKDYKPRQFNFKWIGAKDIYIYRSKEGEVMEYNAQNNSTSMIMDNSTFRQFNTDVYFVSEDLKFVLLAYEIEQVYRHSFLARYVIYNRYAKSTKDKIVQFPQDTRQQWRTLKLQYAGWSATGSSLSFVYKNNLYHQLDPFTTVTRITTSGVEGVIFNGIPDWLYEEEIFHSNRAHWWSEDNTYICYASIDDTQVPVYKFPHYGHSIYGDIEQIPYPKAGDRDENITPVPRIFIADTSNPAASHNQLLPPEELRGSEYYVQQVAWRDTTHVMIVWSNRPQNMSVITICDAGSGDCFFNIAEKSKGGQGWVDMPHLRFIHGGENYLTILPERDGHHGYWKHIVMVTTTVGRAGLRTFITQGTWDITEIVGSNEQLMEVYYLSSKGDPRRRHLYKVAIPDSSLEKLKPECISCEYHEDCRWVNAAFSRTGKYYILQCLGPGIPYFVLKSTTDRRDIVLEDNAEFRARLSKKALPKIHFYEITTEENHKIWAKVLLPPSLNEDHVLIYPLLVQTYGSPGTQRVTEEFSIGYETYLTSTERVICVSVDGRGSGGRGDSFLYQVYRRLGTVDVDDQISGGKFMIDSFKYVDRERAAIWGWSYGGFMAAHVVGDTSDVFTCGISVAPVTDWRYYDTAFSEKYMGLANSNDNYRGYDNANVSRKAANFKGKDFMIVHGSADDNVHFQHTAQFIKALTEADVDFRVQVYSDKNHAMSGQRTLRHLYRTMTKFLHQCWDGGKPRDLEEPERKIKDV